jgi:transcriptional regulator with XRE-family HTH domain
MKENKLIEIGSRIREMRELSDVSAKDMAEHLNVPVETYTGYEEGKLDIPVSILFEIGKKFNVDMSLLLTGEEPRMQIFTVTRKGEGVEVERRKQYIYQSLAEKFARKVAEPFLVTFDPRKNKPPENSHREQEFDYILEGTLKITINENEIVLNEGDSIYFDSSYGHSMEALNDRPARTLTIVM